jgi:drug/metabolite transporter (DMT)-like permease
MQVTFIQGVLLIVSAAILWALSGVSGQYLFQNFHTDASWLITVRQLTAGAVFLGFLLIRQKNIFQIFKKRQDWLELLLFTFFGLLPAQYGFYVCISLSNAAMAPILQYTAPTMIVLWLAFRKHKPPEGREILGIFLTLIGVFLVSTHGRVDQLVISPGALFWGLLSAVGLAIYTVAPVRLLKTFSTTIVMGWGQLLSGLFLSFFFNPFNSGSPWNVPAVAAMVYIVIGGTVIPFSLYLLGLTAVGPTKASLISCMEPMASIVLVVLVLGTPLTLLDVIGMVCIIATVLLLSVQKK